MGFFRSIKFQIWLRFEIVVLLILVLSNVLMATTFAWFYEMMKTEELDQSLQTIRENWYDEDIGRVIERVAIDNKMYVEIYFHQNNISIPFNNSGGALTFANISKYEYCESVRQSEDGIVYRRFRDMRENNTVLMMCSYIGASKEYPEAYIFIGTYLQPLGTTFEIFKRIFALVALVTLVFAAAVSLVFAAKIANPIIRMNEAAKSLPSGRFDNINDPRDFEEIRQLNATLGDASKEIAKSDGLRRELMANISHDLRTPLTMIKAYAEMIRDLSGDNPEKRDRHLKIIIAETDRLSSLVNDILDLSKLEAGVSEINRETFNFGERLGGVVSRFDILKESDGITIELNAGASILIDADPIKLEQVVYNLINNAVTYAGDDNMVIVRLYRTVQKTVRFEVTDHGDGISPENLSSIWDRYYKASERNATHKRAKLGSGIGLSIVKNILEQHGFDYGVNSVVGEGSTFWFEAPDPLAEPDEPQQRTSRRKKQ